MSTVVIEQVVAPLKLKATTSSTSPSRSRRAFRFSNHSDHKQEVEKIGNTSFSWGTHDASKTPSPVSVPLPLSIPPKKILGKPSPFPASHTNNQTWLPFQEPRFAQALVTAICGGAGIEYVYAVLQERGGFARLWKELGLGRWNAPGEDIRACSHQEIADVIHQARASCGHPASLVDQYGWSPFNDLYFPDGLVAATHAIGLDNVHDFLSQPGGFAKLWEEMGLQPASGPENDTRILDHDEIELLVKKAQGICCQGPRINKNTPEKVKPTSDSTTSLPKSSDSNSFAALSSDDSHRRRQQQYSGEVSTINEPMTSEESDERPSSHCGEYTHVLPCSDETCGMCKSRTGYEDSLAGDLTHSGDVEDKENAPPTTPLKRSPARASAAKHRTPKQSDYVPRPFIPFLAMPARCSPNRIFGSEDSEMSTTSSFGYSEDERYAENIV